MTKVERKFEYDFSQTWVSKTVAKDSLIKVFLKELRIFCYY